MPTFNTIPWNRIRRLPKEHLITVAWAQFPRATGELGEYARLQLSRAPHLGARRNGDLDAAPLKAVKRPLRQAMEEDAVVAALVCLWADARKVYLTHFRQQAAVLAHLLFRPDWSWQSALGGVVVDSPLLDEAIQDAFRRPLLAQAEREGIAGTDHDFVLACYWLSGAVTPPLRLTSVTRLPTDERMERHVTRYTRPRPISREVADMPNSEAAQPDPPQDPAEVPCVLPAPEPASAAAPRSGTSSAVPPSPEKAMEHVTEHVPDITDVPDVTELPLSLADLREHVHTQRRLLLQTGDQIQALAGELAEAALQLNARQAQAHVTALCGVLQKWEGQTVAAAEIEHAVSERLAAEMSSRPGVVAGPYTPQPAPKWTDDSGTAAGVEPGTGITALAQLAGNIDELLAYDTKRADLLASLAQQRRLRAARQAELATWRDGENKEPEGAKEIGEIGEIEEIASAEPIDLAQLDRALQETEANVAELALQISQQQQLQQRRIEELLDRLRDLSLAPKTVVYAQTSLAEVQQGVYRGWPAHQVLALRQALSSLVDRLLLEQKASSVAAQAAELNESWTPATLVHLLDALAKQKLDAEALLLLLAINAARPMPQPVELSASSVWALLAGFEQLAGESGGVELLALLAPELLLGWRPQDAAGRTHLCVALAAAERCAGGCRASR